MNRNERLIARVLLTEAMKAGWEISAVNDGDTLHENKEDCTLEGALSLANQLADDVRFHLRVPKARSETGKTINGWVWLIFGNGDEGLTVISDYTTNLGRYEVGQDKDTPGVTPNPHGFMELVEQFNDGLDAHVKGTDGHKTSELLAYAKTDRLELMAGELALQLRQMVDWYGDRTPVATDGQGVPIVGQPGEHDELLPAERQESPIAAAMQLLERLGPL